MEFPEFLRITQVSYTTFRKKLIQYLKYLNHDFLNSKGYNFRWSHPQRLDIDIQNRFLF
jgi:hypothetical protein